MNGKEIAWFTFWMLVTYVVCSFGGMLMGMIPNVPLMIVAGMGIVLIPAGYVAFTSGNGSTTGGTSVSARPAKQTGVISGPSGLHDYTGASKVTAPAATSEVQPVEIKTGEEAVTSTKKTEGWQASIKKGVLSTLQFIGTWAWKGIILFWEALTGRYGKGWSYPIRTVLVFVGFTLILSVAEFSPHHRTALEIGDTSVKWRHISMALVSVGILGAVLFFFMFGNKFVAWRTKKA